MGHWLDRTYDPHHAALVIVGDVDPVATEALVREWLGGWNEQSQPWPAPLEALPTAPHPRMLVTPRAGRQARVTLACAAPAKDPRDEVGLQLLAEILSENLDQSVRQTMGATYGFQAGLSRIRGGFAELAVTGEVDASQLPRVLRELHHRWALLPIALNETEINRARWGLARRYSVRFLSGLDLAVASADVLRRGRPLSTVDDFPKLLNDLSRAELQKLAKTCAQDSALSVVGEPKGVDAALTGIWK